MVRRRFMLLGAMAAMGCRTGRQGRVLNAGAPQARGAAAPIETCHKFLPSATPDVPNRTKVVRLIVVPNDVDPDDANRVTPFARGQNAAKTDVFIVRDKDRVGWHPRSWLGTGPLIDHAQAVRQDVETVLLIWILQREQIQWESDVEFKIASIQKKSEKDAKDAGLINNGDAPDNPFEGLQDLIEKGQKPARLIRSGPPSLNDRREYNQLYKVRFAMTIDGMEREIDPDVYCEWG